MPIELIGNFVDSNCYVSFTSGDTLYNYKTAKATLKKIKSLLVHQVISGCDEIKHSLSPIEIFGRLKKTAQKVKDDYTNYIASSGTIAKLFSSLLKQNTTISKLYEDISTFEYPFENPELLTDQLALWKAVEYGYKEGAETPKKYLQNLYEEVKALNSLKEPNDFSSALKNVHSIENKLVYLSQCSLALILPLYQSNFESCSHLAQFLSHSSFINQTPDERQIQIVYQILERAIQRGTVGVIGLVLKLGAQPDPDAQIFNVHGSPFILRALQAQRRALCISLLLENHANVNITGREGRTALHTAILELDTQLVNLLLSYGADIRIPDINGDMPFHLIVKGKRHADRNIIIKQLLERGADWNAIGANGKTVLHIWQETLKAEKEQDEAADRDYQIRMRFMSAVGNMHLHSDNGRRHDTITFSTITNALMKTSTTSDWSS